MARTTKPEDPAPKQRRLAAADRRRSILEAARRCFEDVGDLNGTTMRTIAQRAGISEGVIYRHFDGKEQLFYEAVVEPLREAVDSLVEQTDAVDPDGTLSAEVQLVALTELYERLTSTLAEVLPLLGLVLFGDPVVARRFYREHFSVAMDRLAQAWAEAEERHGLDVELAAISARAVMGGALVLAIESTHGDRKVSRETFEGLALGAARGYFPSVGSGLRPARAPGVEGVQASVRPCRCQPADRQIRTGSDDQPRTVEVRARTAWSPSTSQSGKRSSISSSTTRPSMRASAAPRQKWMP